jgi:ABC-2 type transport system permease protein
MHTYGWLIRREFWENRAIWIVPALLGVALTVSILFGRLDIVVSPEQQRIIGPVVLWGYGSAFFVVMSIYCTWYLLECLYADRKDRSVLFWKSLPITDSDTVLAKLLTGVIAIPLVYFLAADISTLLMAFIISIRAHAYAGLWRPDAWLQLQVLWLYVIITTAVWFLPLYGWFMLVSAWARRAVILWFILPPLALYWAERRLFGTHWLGSQLLDRTLGYIPRAFHGQSSGAAWVTTTIGNENITTPSSVWRLLDPVGFFSSPATWIGVLVGAALIYGTIQLRLRRTEI